MGASAQPPDELAAFLRGEAGRRFELGRADCCTLVADWIVQKLGTDPMAAHRSAAASLVSDPRGMVRTTLRAMRGICPRTCDPRSGDVALVAINGTAAGAIRTPRGWTVRCRNGLARVPHERVRVIAAWSV